MRVAQLLPAMNQGGVERGVVDLNRELVRCGVENFVISTGGRLVDQIEREGGHHRMAPVASKNPLTAPYRAAVLRRLLMTMRPDIVHVRSRVPGWLCRLAWHRPPFAIVTTVHGMYRSGYYYSGIMGRGRRVICASRATWHYAGTRLRVPEDKLTLIPRGVDTDYFDPARVNMEKIQALRKKYDLAADKSCIISVGRLSENKGHDLFIRAMALATANAPDQLCGVIIGAGSRQAFLQNLINTLQVPVRIARDENSLPEWYTLARAVVSASRLPETFGRSMAEALAMGRPVIAAAHGGALDIIIDGDNGLLFAPNDAEALAAALTRLPTSTGEGRLRDRVVENFSLKRMAESTLAVYREVLA